MTSIPSTETSHEDDQIGEHVIERADFDCNLFDLEVGRLELCDEDVQKIMNGESRITAALQRAHTAGYELIYLTTPNYNPQCQTLLMDLESSLIGTNVDYKTTYRAPLEFFSKHHLECQSPTRKSSSSSTSSHVTCSKTSGSSSSSSSSCSCSSCINSTSSSSSSSGGGGILIHSSAFADVDIGAGSGIRIEPHPFDPSLESQLLSPELRELALASGQYSRFKVDPVMPSSGYDQLFTAWIQNSINRTLAHETFVAVDLATGKHVGMITLKQKGEALVDVGLVAVAPTHRRKGVASMLLSKATLWAIDKIGHLTETHNPTLQVVTQGANLAACKTYEKHGFTVSSVQVVNHVWLPAHLENASNNIPVRDRASIPYCKQYLTGNERNYIHEILDSRLLDSTSKFTTLCSQKLQISLNSGIIALPIPPPVAAPAPQLLQNEEKLLKNMKCERVLITNSGTAALEMAAILCDIKEGDEIIMPSYTFSSTANAFVLRGGVPVFVDIREDTLNINEQLIEAAVTKKTRAICCVHYAGIPCEMDEIMDIAQRHSLYVVEDAAQAFLSTYKGRKLGSIGHFGCFSFHYTKNIICGEGGALSVNCSQEMVRRALILWEKGTNRCDFMSGKIDKYEWVDVGSSHVPSEINCAILYAQLEQCEEITKKRLTNYSFYYEAFVQMQKGKENEYFRLPQMPEHAQNNAHIFFIILPSVAKRDLFQKKMKERGVAAFSHYVPLHSAPAGLKYGRVGTGSEGMQVTNTVYNGLLRLPVWVGLEHQDLSKVVSAVEGVINEIK